MKVVFRVDASPRIGSGHLMRCITLARELSNRGDAVTFVTRQHAGHMAERIEEWGFRVLRLAPPDEPEGAEARRVDPDHHSAWLGVGQEEDAMEVLRVLDGEGDIDWVIADHYSLGVRWESALRERAGAIAVFDDLADRRHDVDLLVDQTAGRRPHEYRALVPRHSRLLLGPMYAPLRPEFARLREEALARRRQRRQSQRLLVMMGGFDPDDATSVVLEGLAEATLPKGTRVEVVMGADAPGLHRVRALAAEVPWPTTVASSVTDVAERMAAADLAIGAAGTTSWERCCLGLPSVVMTIAANQSRIAAELAEAGAAIRLGDLRDNRGRPERIGYEVAGLLADSGRLARMSEAAAGVVDGLGAQRLARALHSGIVA